MRDCTGSDNEFVAVFYRGAARLSLSNGLGNAWGVVGEMGALSNLSASHGKKVSVSVNAQSIRA